MKRKLISILCLSVMMLSTITGCSKGSSTGSTTGSKAAPTEINVMVWDRGTDKLTNGMSVTDNNLTKFIKEKVLAEKNVKVNYVTVPRSGSDDKINAMMAGGNAPDLIVTYSIDLFGNFATQGGIVDLTSALKTDGANISKYVGKDTLDVGVLDNKQYAVMARRGVQVSRHMGYIRKDWLDTLGLPVPKTTDELIKDLYAFKQQDPGKLASKNIPWAMGGTTDSEKYYLNFVNQYVQKPYDDANSWLYQENQSIMNPQAKTGFQEMNKLYNDGIISKDFAIDTKDDKYVSDITNGNVGFFLDDSFAPFDKSWITTAQKNNPKLQYVALNCFTGVNNEYKNPAEPTYGAYLMVPKKSEAKASAVVKYMDWLADPNNAIKVANYPTFTNDSNGLPVNTDIKTDEDRIAKGYPKVPDDLNLVNKHFTFMDDEAKVAAFYTNMYNGRLGNNEDMTSIIKSVRTAMKVYPVQQAILSNSSKYGKPVRDQAIQFAYKTISAPTAQFDATYTAEYQKVVQAGFDKILTEKQAYYDSKVKK